MVGPLKKELFCDFPKQDGNSVISHTNFILPYNNCISYTKGLVILFDNYPKDTYLEVADLYP